MSVRSLLARERFLYGAWVLARRLMIRSGAAFHGRVLGWKQSSIPFGSIIMGTKYIHVEPGFHATGRVWVEAVASYGSDSFAPSIRIGRNFNATERVHISAIESIEIGNDCLFGSNIYIADHAHGNYRQSSQFYPEESPARRRLSPTGAVSIGDRCWVGDNVVILGGVTVGSSAVIAANSVVLKDVPPMTIVAGAPAKVVKTYDPESHQWTRNSALTF
jgi:acetyltransferase-like isoleucine patch superfamily enzyme